MANQLTINRLNKEEMKVLKNPPPNAVVRRKGLLHFHFCIYGLDGDYKDGFYHGVLELAADYPFAPPKLKFFTPSGRFNIDAPICTTFTNFHKQTWSTIWNVETMVIATVSFLQSSEHTNGSIKNATLAQKRSYAQKSMEFNVNNPLFMELFADDPVIGPKIKEVAGDQKNDGNAVEDTTASSCNKSSIPRKNNKNLNNGKNNNNQNRPGQHTQGDLGSQLLMVGLGIVLVGYVYFRVFS